jgi:hypothetical protein
MIKMLKRIFTVLVLLSCAGAEIAFSGGLTWGSASQTLSGAERGVKISELSLRPAYFVELDSFGHPLFLENDFVAFGLGWLTETAHKDLLLTGKYLQMSVPFYATYYLRYGTQAVGFGLNLNLLQLRYRDNTARQGQQLGKHLFWRINSNSGYVELGVMQLCARGDYPDEELVSFYESLNFIWRYGFYLGGQNSPE